MCVYMCVHECVRKRTCVWYIREDKIGDLRERGGQYIEQSEFEIQSTSFQQTVHEAYQLISHTHIKIAEAGDKWYPHWQSQIWTPDNYEWNKPRPVCMHR